MTAIGAGLDLFSKKFDVKIPTPEEMGRVVDGIRLAVSTLVERVRQFNADYKMTYGTGGQMGVFNEFATTAGTIMDAIQKAFDVFSNQPSAEVTPGKTANPFDHLTQLVNEMVIALQTVDAQFAALHLTMTIDDIQKLVDLASGIMDALEKFFSFNQTSVESTTGGTQSIQAMISANLQSIMALIQNFVGTFKTEGSDLIENFATGLKNPSALKNLDDALTSLQNKITSALSGMGTLTINWSSGGGGMHAAGEADTSAGGASSGSLGSGSDNQVGGSAGTAGKGIQPREGENQVRGSDQYAPGGVGNPTGHTVYWSDDQGNTHMSISDDGKTWYNDPVFNFDGTIQSKGTPGGPPVGKAGGGSVFPGNTYVVGENGPEVLHMGSGGGGTIFNGVGGGEVRLGGFNGRPGSGGVGGISVPGGGGVRSVLDINVMSGDGSLSRVDQRTLSELISNNIRSSFQHSASVR
jgi:hypothetical protein